MTAQLDVLLSQLLAGLSVALLGAVIVLAGQLFDARRTIEDRDHEIDGLRGRSPRHLALTSLAPWSKIGGDRGEFRDREARTWPPHAAALPAPTEPWPDPHPDDLRALGDPAADTLSWLQPIDGYWDLRTEAGLVAVR